MTSMAQVRFPTGVLALLLFLAPAAHADLLQHSSVSEGAAARRSVNQGMHSAGDRHKVAAPNGAGERLTPALKDVFAFHQLPLFRLGNGRIGPIVWHGKSSATEVSSLYRDRRSASARGQQSRAPARARGERIGGRVRCKASEHAVFGLNVSTFGPLLGCVEDVMRCIETKRDQCLSRAVVSGDLAMYCPKLSRAEKGDCVESFLRTRCSSAARSCLRDCRGIPRSRGSYDDGCREREHGQLCLRYTMFHQQRIETQNICVPRNCNARVVSQGLARYYGRLRHEHVSEARSLSASAMDDMVVCGGGQAGNPRHVSTGNRAIDVYHQSPLPHQDTSSPPDPSSPESRSESSRNLPYPPLLPAFTLVTVILTSELLAI